MTNAGRIPIALSLTTRIAAAGDAPTDVRLSYDGHRIERGGTSYLLYEEPSEAGAIRTTVKVGEGEALILRSGALSMRLPLALGMRRPGTYNAGFGDLAVEVETAELTASAGELRAMYRLYMEGRLIGDYEMHIRYTERS